MASKIESFLRALAQRRPRAIKHRLIRPQDPDRPSLATLSQELLDLVAEHLHGIDPQSLDGLALACSALYRAARDVQCRDVSIDLAWSTKTDRLDSMARNGLLPAIRTLRVRPPYDIAASLDPASARPRSSWARKRAADVAAWDRVCGLVPRMAGLRDLHWESEVVPDRVLAHLSQTPRVRLHLSILDQSSHALRFSERGVFLRRLPGRLAATPGFSSLRLGVVYGSEAACRAFVDDYLRPLLFSSPRLRALSINIGPPTSGCTAGNFAFTYSGFGLSPGDTLPPLEELEMTAYPWGISPSRGVPPGGWPFGIGGYPVGFVPEMQNWARLLDWSRLRRLSLNFECVELAAHLAPHLTALQHLELGGDLHLSVRLAIPALLAGLRTPSLRSIALPCLPDAPDAVPPFIPLITAHAPTLHTLSIHKEPVSPSDLALLSASLPSLAALTLCLARDPDPPGGAWPRGALAQIAAFPALADLTLWFELGRGRLSKPYLTFSAAEGIAEMLRDAGAAGLRRLRVNSGFPPAPRQGLYFPDGPEWPEEGMRTAFEIVGGGGAEGVVVRCVRLGWKGNERLRMVAKGEAAMSPAEKRQLAFVVALRGPMGYDEWLGWRGGGR